MKLNPKWRTAFNAAIEAHRPEPFAWGTHDCGILTADCIKALLGVDIAYRLRGRYDSALSAKKVLNRHGFRSAEAVVAKRFKRVPASQAQTGDIAVVKGPMGMALAPVSGAELCVYGDDGVFGMVPLSDALRAYRIEPPPRRRPVKKVK